MNLLYETNKMKKGKGEKEHQIKLYLSDGVYTAHKGLFYPKYVTTHVVKPGSVHNWKDYGLEMSSIRTKHSETTGTDSGFGMRLKSKTRRKLDMGITGDTGYFRGLEREFDGTRILIAHIGRLRDLLSKGPSGKHLSFAGIVALVSRLSITPDLVVISEFGEEFRGRRVEVCKKLEKHILNQGPVVHCIPAERNMCVKLSSGSLKIGRADVGTYHSVGNLKTTENWATHEIYYD